MALSFILNSRNQSAIISYVKCVQGLLITKYSSQRKCSFREKSSQAFTASQEKLFSPLDPRELTPSKKYPLAGIKYLVGSDGKGFPEFLAVPRQGLPQAYKIEHADQLSIKEWAQHCRKLLDEDLPKYGAVLFRGLPLSEGEHFSLFTSALGYTFMGYEGGVTDRPAYDEKSKVLLASAEPQEITIELHNEMSYLPNYPQKIIFHCDVPPAKGSGGLTPIARNSEALEQLDPKVVQKFEEKKVRYIRKLPCEGTGLPYIWESAFRTQDRKEVETFLEDGKFSYIWNEDDSLDFWCNLPAIIHHPLTKEKVWFNQAHTHHCTYWKNEPVYEKIIFDSDTQYPTNTAYGDGTEIELEVIQHIRESIWKCAIGFEWEKGDTLILDNIQIMHGRLSFTGDRRILVSLSSD